MKKLPIMLIALMLCATLCACNNKDNTDPNNDSDLTSSIVEEESTEDSEDSEDLSEENSSEEASSENASEEASSEESSSEESSSENSSEEESSENTSSSEKDPPVNEKDPPVEDKELDDAKAREALDKAAQKLSEAENLTLNTTTSVGFSADGFDISSSSLSTTQLDGKNFKVATDDDIELGSWSVTVSDGVCYMTEGEDVKYKFPVTDAQSLVLLSIYADLGIDSLDADAYSNLSGVVNDDGSTTVTVVSLSDEMLESLLGTDEDTDAQITLDDFSCIITLNKDMLPTSIEMSVEISSEYEGVTSTSSSSISAIYEYGNASISSPDDADEYEEYTYEDIFGDIVLVPDEDKANEVGLPLDAEEYDIAYADINAFNEQYMQLYLYTDFYIGKTFNFSGKVESIGSSFHYTECDAENGYLYFRLEFDGVEIPAPDTTVSMTATLCPTLDEDGYLIDFYMLVTEISEFTAPEPDPDPDPDPEPDPEPDTVKTMYVIAERSLNVRSTPDFNADNVIGWLMHGDAVDVIGSGTGDDGRAYYVIMFEGEQAYISANPLYISETKPE